MDTVFPGMQKPSTDFGAVRNQLKTRPFYFDIDLSTARSITAGTQLNVNAAGNFLYCDVIPNSGIAAVHFEDVTSGSTPIGIFPGASFGVPFTQLAFENIAQPGMKLRIVFGTDVQFYPSNAAGVSVLNSITVVDGGKVRTLAGQAFAGSVGIGALAGNFSHVQIYNPSAVNRTIVRGLSLRSAGAQSVLMYEYDTQLTTLANLIPSKLVGGAAGATQLRTQQAAGQLITGSPFDTFALVAGVTLFVPIAEPYVLAPGKGLVLVPSAVNLDVTANFETVEEPHT